LRSAALPPACPSFPTRRSSDLYMALRVSRDRNVRVYRLALFLSILPLILSKLAGLWGESIFAFLGISYLTFRCAQIIIETYDGRSEEHTSELQPRSDLVCRLLL